MRGSSPRISDEYAGSQLATLLVAPSIASVWGAAGVLAPGGRGRRRRPACQYRGSHRRWRTTTPCGPRDCRRRWSKGCATTSARTPTAHRPGGDLPHPVVGGPDRDRRRRPPNRARRGHDPGGDAGPTLGAAEGRRPARCRLLRRRRLVRPPRPRDPGARTGERRRRHRGLGQPRGRRTGGGPRRRCRPRGPGGRRSTSRATSPHTVRTVRTGASTARTSCSPGSPTRSSTGCGSAPSPTARTPTTRDGRTGRVARAATAHAVLRPLADLGLTKTDVRSLARDLGLPNADKPAAPCLASRIPHFTEVDAGELAQVEAAELAVRALGFADCRVRHHGEVARVELLEDDLVRAVAPEVRTPTRGRGSDRRVPFVTVDLARIQSGSVHPPAGGPVSWLSRPASSRASRTGPRPGRHRGYPEAVYCEGKSASRSARSPRRCGRSAARSPCSAARRHSSRCCTRSCPMPPWTTWPGWWPGRPPARSRSGAASSSLARAPRTFRSRGRRC